MPTGRPGPLGSREFSHPTRRRFVTLGSAAMAAAASSTFALPTFFTKARAATTLKFWQFYSPGGTVAPQDEWFKTMVESWNSQNDVKVELEYIVNSEYVNGSKLQTAFASGAGPDLFIISPGDFLRYYNGGALQEITPAMEPDAVKDFIPDVIATRAVDNKFYCLPMEVEPMAFYYSLDAWEGAGLTDSDIPQTWDQLLDVAEKLTTDDRFGVLFETIPGYYQNFTWYPFFWQGGGKIVNDDGKTSGLAEKAGVQALKLWKDAIDKGVAPRQGLAGGGDIVANLGAGYCAIQNVGIWGIGAMRANAPDFRYDIFKLPIPEGGTYSTIAGGWGFAANSKGADPETAAKFCAWAIGSMSEDSVQRGVDWIIKAKSDMPPRTSVLDKATADGGFSEGGMKTFAEDIFPGARGEPRVPPEVYKAISDAIQACQLNGADPQQTAETAAKQIEQFLSTYQGAPIL